MHIASILMGALALTSPGHPPEVDAVRLPRAVSVTALTYNADKPNEPFDKVIAEIGPEWVRSEQHLATGSFGFRLYDFTYETNDESLLFNADSKRGQRSLAFRDYGSSRQELFVTPIGFVRLLDRYEANGRVVERVEEPGKLVLGMAEPTPGIKRAEIVIDRDSGLIKEVRLPSPRRPGLVEYSNWKTLADGSRHPMTIHFTAWMDGSKVIDSETRIEAISLMDPAKGPTPYTLPVEAEITDTIRGIVTNGAGKEIGKIPEATPAPRDISAVKQRMSWNRVAAAGGAALIVVAAILFKRRQGALAGAM